MNIDEGKPIFKIYDYVYIRSNLFNIGLGVIGLSFYDSNSIFYSAAAVFILGWVIVSFLKILFLNKNRDIEFYDTKIVNTKEHLTLEHKNIEEVHVVTFFTLMNFHTRIVRFNIFQKVFQVFIILIILWVPYIIVEICMMVYHRRLQFYKALIITKTDDRGIVIQIPLNDNLEQQKLNAYLKKHLNIDITKMETKVFTPRKG